MRKRKKKSLSHLHQPIVCIVYIVCIVPNDRQQRKRRKWMLSQTLLFFENTFSIYSNPLVFRRCIARVIVLPSLPVLWLASKCPCKHCRLIQWFEHVQQHANYYIDFFLFVLCWNCGIPLRKSEFGQQSVSCRASSTWNTIPTHIRELETSSSLSRL